MPPMMFGNSLIKVASEFSNANERPLAAAHNERKSSHTKHQTKSQIKKKRSTVNKKAMKHADAMQQAENLILNTKYSDESNECLDRNSSPHIDPNNADSPPNAYEKQEQKLSNTPDILSMVLSIKKNALMHDPYVIQFISSIR